MSGLGKSITNAILLVCLAACSSTDAPPFATGSLAPTASAGSATIQGTPPFDCVATRHELTALADGMSGLGASARTEANEFPKTAVAALQRLSDPRGVGLESVARYERDHARYTRQRTAAEQHSCPTADIDEKFKTAVASMEAFRTGR